MDNGNTCTCLHLKSCDLSGVLPHLCLCHAYAAGPDALAVPHAVDGQARQRPGASQEHLPVSKAAARHVSRL